MPAEDPIRIDASTVHRAVQPVGDPDAPSKREAVGPTGNTEESSHLVEKQAEVDEISEANTVIRGSSRVEKSKPPPDILDRTPASVTKGLLGTHLNHFHLEAFIGGGGMGAVFRGHDEQLDRTVAIKVIPFVGDDPDLQRRFRNEAQSAAKLDHLRIARVFDVGSHGDWHYIVFEYIEGTNIRDFVTSNTVLPIDDAVFYTCQLADALQHAADRGIVHRDIKPSNILIGKDSKIKLVDMGLARSDNLDLSEDMTASGVTLGTFDYISPEQAKDPRDADLRSDIYSLGCTLYFMLTGSPPYPGGTMLQKLLSHGNTPPPDTRELRPEVSEHLVAVIRKMLAKNPADRYQTAFDLIADLREVAMRDGLVRSQALSPVTIAQPNPMFLWLEKHAPWIVALMVLIAIAGWLQLESAARRDSLIIPGTAVIPDVGQAKASADVILPMTRNPGDSEYFQGSPWEPQPEPSRLPDAALPTDVKENSVNFTPILIDNGGSQSDILSELNATGSTNAETTGDGTTQIPKSIRLIGSQDSITDSGDAAIASTLKQALAMAAQYNVQLIEIMVPEIVSEPVDLQVDDLWIRSTVSGGTQIRFESAGGFPVERSTMVDVGSNEVVFEDIHFVWQVPSGSINGGAFFAIKENPLVRLTDCSITVSNPNLRERVYAFDVITDSASNDEESSDFPVVKVELNNVVVRGQMTMLHMDYAAQLRLDWDDGLLSVSGSMIETAGARTLLPDDVGFIALEFWRVTVHAAEGIFRMRAYADAPYPVLVDRRAKQSVFIVDENQPHFEFSGLQERFKRSGLLQLHGSSNAYQVGPDLREVMLRVDSDEGLPELTKMIDIKNSPPPWAEEKSPRWSANLVKMPLPRTPVSERVPADYEQTDTSPLGFTQESLPTLPLLENNENEGLSIGPTL
ncbi:MAG: serine/threonine-protein kinase [Rubripirellula sp.]|nr:serine/threonine-protein kinase [Rubripirellula sp.]